MSVPHVDAEISAAYGKVYCLVELQDRPYETEFNDCLRILIAHQNVGHSGSHPVHESAGGKAAVLKAQSSFILNGGTGAGRYYMHCHKFIPP